MDINNAIQNNRIFLSKAGDMNTASVWTTDSGIFAPTYDFQEILNGLFTHEVITLPEDYLPSGGFVVKAIKDFQVAIYKLARDNEMIHTINLSEDEYETLYKESQENLDWLKTYSAKRDEFDLLGPRVVILPG